MNGISAILQLRGKYLLFVVFIFYIAMSFMFNYRFSFNYENEIHDHYHFIFYSICINIFLNLLWFFQTNSISRPYFLIISLSAAIVINILYSFSEFYSFSNEHFSMLVVGLYSYFLFLYLGTNSLNYLLFLILGLWALQLSIVSIQILLGRTTNNLTGTFENSGVLSLYLMLHIPLFAYVLFKKITYEKKNFKWNYLPSFFSFKINRIFILIFFACYVFGIAIIAKSRTTVVSSLLVMSIWIFINYRFLILEKLKNLRKIYLIGIVVLVILFVSFTSYYILSQKKMSAIGRLVMWDTTLNNIDKFSLTGTGLGRFTYYYPYWQAKYFENHINPPDNFFLSAGESYIIFNENLQLFGEVGLFGFIVWVLYLFYFFQAKSTHHKNLINNIKLTMSFILIAAFTSYPFHINSIILIIVFCFAAVELTRDNSLLNYLPRQNLKWIGSFLFSIYFILSVKTLQIGFKNYKAAITWEKIDPNESSLSEIKNLYDQIYLILNKDGKFLTSYSLILYNENLYRKSKEVMERAKRYFISRNMMESFIAIYMSEGDHYRAIEGLEWLTNYIPNLFSPKQMLFNEYIFIGEIDKAQLLGNKIINMPVKFPSKEIDNIRNEVKIKLSQIENKM